MLSIESLTEKDYPSIKALQPEGWTDIMVYVDFYCKSAVCFPFKAVLNNLVVGMGCIITHKETAWLAHIIVHPDFRGKGTGSRITESLIAFAEQKSIKTISLIATAAGEPVYKKLGFQPETEYILLNEGNVFAGKDDSIRDYNPQYRNSILELDYNITGENRVAILEEHLNKGYIVLSNGNVTGFYLPTLGEGLILADEETAGLALLKFKHSKPAKTGLPITNSNAVALLLKHGYKEVFRGKKMILGKQLSAHPQKIYSRIGGNLG